MMKRKFVFIVFIFLVMLSAGRFIWLDQFKPSEQPIAIEGKLDLQEWDPGVNKTITLDGVWRFYPRILLMSDQSEQQITTSDSQLIDVPSGWNENLQQDLVTPYGYGSYRLSIEVGSSDEVYSIYIPSVRSSSQLYVNGRLMASSGRPAASEEEHIAKNVPYITTFMADEHGIIDIVIQVANYTDSRSGGLIRSLKFGTDVAIYNEKQRSLFLQQLIATTLIIQAIYMFVLFVIERNKFWFYFALAMLCFTLILLNSTEDKILLQWLPISLAWSFRLLCFASTILVYSMLQTLIAYVPKAWRSGVLKFYSIAALAGVGASVLTPLQFGNFLAYVITLCAFPILILLVFSVFRKVEGGMQSQLLKFLVLLAFGNHLAWWVYFIVSGMKILFYPFDLILGIILLSLIGMKRYFTMYTDQKVLTMKLEAINRKKDEFLANTSHELRNPLHGIINMSQVVLERERERDALSEVSIRELETALKVGKRMSYMLNDLLDVALIKESGLQMNIQSIALRPVVEGAMDIVRYMVVGKNIQLYNRIAESFPYVLADENRLIQILLNLLHNAMKFTHQGEICMEAYTEKGYAYITVSDTGIGMDDEFINKVFEPYEQAQSLHGYEGGFGLGLNICRQLVAFHGGTITVDSAPSEGSRFTFTLKLSDRVNTIPKKREVDPLNLIPSDVGAEQMSMLKEQTEDQQSPLGIYKTARPRILVVDDDVFNLDVLTSILSSDEYEVVTVMNGEDALALIIKEKWELVITDIMMPRMSGYELTKRIRERYTLSDLPILMLTARSHPEDIEIGYLSGANDYVTKPVEAKELRARVQAWTRLTNSIRDGIRMEAAWLQAQIEPHFLLNTLNTIAALHTVNPAQMQELIGFFGDFLRRKFELQNVGELIPMQDELTLVRSYLFIEQTRFDDRLKVEWEIDSGMEVLLLPPYSIQPLVENAIHHGLMQRKQGGKVQIRLIKHGKGAEIFVSDDGVGMSEEVVGSLLSSVGTDGIALRNVDLRLKRLYGAGLNITSTPGEGTTVSFIIQ